MNPRQRCRINFQVVLHKIIVRGKQCHLEGKRALDDMVCCLSELWGLLGLGVMYNQEDFFFIFLKNVNATHTLAEGMMNRI